MHIKSRADHSTLVQSAYEVPMISPAVIINDIRFSNGATLRHQHSYELNLDLKAWPEDLVLASFLSIVAAFENIFQDFHVHHGEGTER